MKPRFSTLPVVAHSPDGDGLPTKMSVPGLTKTVPIVSNGKRLGEVAPSGAVTWTPAGSKGSWDEFSAQSDALQEAARARKRLRAAVIDGKVAAVVVPPRRK